MGKDSDMLLGMPVVPVNWCVLWAAVNGFLLSLGMCTIVYDRKRALCICAAMGAGDDVEYMESRFCRTSRVPWR